jgi:hypothetical protein
LVTQANTVIVPVKTGTTGGFELEGINGANGQVKWTQTSDYVLPPHNWVPSYSPTLAPGNKLYFAGAGGTIYYITNPDANGASTSGHLAFYGLSNYTANPTSFNSSVFINTPITADSAGNIHFGFMTTGLAPLALQSGIARIAADGTGTWIAASVASADSGIKKVVHNSAPALSNDGQSLYVAVNNGNGTGNANYGYLLRLNSTTLQTVACVRLKDPEIPANDAYLPDDGSASPTVGPDGDVYFGVLEHNGQYASKGWLLHFSADLSQTKTPGAFGWDDTASIVDRSLVPSYTGSSSYLLFTKYNNYAGAGLDGVNKIAILDPNATQVDSRTNTTVMKEVLTIAGQTPDPEFIAQHPNAVREWCINSAVIDPFTKSVLANSEDGKLYRWDLTTNTFTQVITLTPGIGEAYTPTIIGKDGTVYAINNATLFAVGLRPSSFTGAHLDFGTASSPVASGYTQVTQSTNYGAAQGYGWQSGAIVGLDRGTGTDLTRDLNYTSIGTFAVDVPNGSYSVTLTTGDMGAAQHDQMGIFLEGTQVDTVSTAAGQIVTRTYTVTVADGQLNLQMKDLGGSDPNITIEGLDVVPV